MCWHTCTGLPPQRGEGGEGFQRKLLECTQHESARSLVLAVGQCARGRLARMVPCNCLHSSRHSQPRRHTSGPAPPTAQSHQREPRHLFHRIADWGGRPIPSLRVPLRGFCRRPHHHAGGCSGRGGEACCRCLGCAIGCPNSNYALAGAWLRVSAVHTLCAEPICGAHRDCQLLKLGGLRCSLARASRTL